MEDNLKENSNIIYTPVGPREVNKEIINLFELMPTKEPVKSVHPDRRVKWYEENGKMVCELKTNKKERRA